MGLTKEDIVRDTLASIKQLFHYVPVPVRHLDMVSRLVELHSNLLLGQDVPNTLTEWETLTCEILEKEKMSDAGEITSVVSTVTGLLEDYGRWVGLTVVSPDPPDPRAQTKVRHLTPIRYIEEFMEAVEQPPREIVLEFLRIFHSEEEVREFDEKIVWNNEMYD